ncbi:hypothetical protein RJD24_12200 [Bacillaceae bacterium IKA-2]|nr:hypothetical protein RJD24_12200 [Bacillaceae bacterium IKA-2]
MKQFEEMKEYDHHFKSIDKKINMIENEKNEILLNINKKIDSNGTTQSNSSTKWKYYFAVTTAFLILLILSLPLFSEMVHDRTGGMNEDIHQILLDFGGYNEILHKEVVEHGVVVFYIPNIKSPDEEVSASELGAIFIKKTLFGWEGTFNRGGYSTSIPENFTSKYLPQFGTENNSPFPILFGEIINPEITQMNIISDENNILHEAKVITTGYHKIWFVFLDEEKQLDYEVQGLSYTNEIITSISDRKNNIWQSDSKD